MRIVLALLFAGGIASAQTIELAGPVISTAPQFADDVRVAGTATESLAVWIDFDVLRAIRVDFLGRPLDEQSIVIADDDVSRVEVATDGRDYLIAYSTCFSSASDCAAHFATISPDGTVFRSRQRMKDAYVESLVWTGDRYVMAYHEGSRLPTAATLAILDRRGFVLEDDIQPTNEPIYYVDLAADRSGGIALVWAGYHGSAFATGSLDDMRRGALAPRRLPDLFYPLTLAASSSGFIVGGEDAGYRRRTILLSRSGGVTSASTSIQTSGEFAVGATATTRFTVFSEPSPSKSQLGLRMQLVDRAEPAIAVLPSVTTWWGYNVDVAPTSDGGAVVGWSHQIRELTEEVHVRRITPDGAMLRPPAAHEQAVNRGFVAYHSPVVRRCGDTFVAAWVEQSDRKSVRFRRISTAGAVLDPPSRRITSLTINDQFSPDIACTADSMLITWIERTPRVTETPTTTARAMLFTKNEERLIELGAAEDVYAVGIGETYAVFRADKEDWHEGSLLRSDGTQATPWTRLFHQPDCGDGHSVAETNGEQIATVSLNTCPGNNAFSAVTRFFSRDLTLLTYPVVYATTSLGQGPDIAAAPDGWLITYGSSPAHFGRITREFLALDPRNGVTVGDAGGASASWNGCTFEIAGRNAVSLVSMSGQPTRLEVPQAVARVASDGPGARLVVTIERGEDGSMRVVGRLESSRGCVR